MEPLPRWVDAVFNGAIGFNGTISFNGDKGSDFDPAEHAEKLANLKTVATWPDC